MKRVFGVFGLVAIGAPILIGSALGDQTIARTYWPEKEGVRRVTPASQQVPLIFRPALFGCAERDIPPGRRLAPRRQNLGKRRGLGLKTEAENLT